jgi:solute carrier family 25 (mitochondrial carrier protein), member 16
LTASDTTHHPLPESLLEVIQAYLDKHAEFDDHDCQRLHEELMTIHATRVVPQPDKHAIFLAAFRQLMPALQGSERLLTWWDKLVRPTLDSLGQSKAVVADARAIVLSALVYDGDDETSAEKKKAAQLITDRLFEIFLEKTKLLSTDSGAGFAEEERQRFVCSNVEAVLLSFGKRMPQVHELL